MLVGKIEYCKFSRNGVLLRDFIPVKVNSVGYMCDKKTGTLYTNSGTGSFTIGPNVS